MQSDMQSDRELDRIIDAALPGYSLPELRPGLEPVSYTHLAGVVIRWIVAITPVGSQCGSVNRNTAAVRLSDELLIAGDQRVGYRHAA